MKRKGIFLLCVTVFFTSVVSKSTTSPQFGHPKFHDVLKLLPLNKIQAIEQAHLKNDKGFQAAVSYLQSKEWRNLVDAVIKKPEYVVFSKMAEKYHMNISQAISCIRQHIESLEVTEKPTAEPNLEPFIKEVQDVLPIGDMARVLFSEIDDITAKKIRDEIASKENQKIAEAMHNLPEMVKMRDILKRMKFDVEPYIALVFMFLGWVH